MVEPTDEELNQETRERLQQAEETKVQDEDKERWDKERELAHFLKWDHLF